MLDKEAKKIKAVIIDASGVVEMDLAALAVVDELVTEMEKREVRSLSQTHKYTHTHTHNQAESSPPWDAAPPVHPRVHPISLTNTHTHTHTHRWKSSSPGLPLVWSTHWRPMTC
jgi:hypothetical protein